MHPSPRELQQLLSEARNLSEQISEACDFAQLDK